MFFVNLDSKKQDNTLTFVHELVPKFGQKELRFGRTVPTTLKPVLKYVNLEVVATSKHAKSDQIVHMPPTREKN